MKNNIFQSDRKVSPSEEQQSIDVFKGIGNPGKAGPHRSQADVTVPNDVVNRGNAETSRM